MKQASVLIVDDEVKILEVVQSYLEAQGYQVFTAQSGKEAFELLEQEAISLVLLDLMLPDISGEEICSTIRQTSRVPIVMLTAKIEEEDMLRGLDLGADDYITKPFSLRALHARIKAVLRRSETTGPLYQEISFGGGDLVIHLEQMLVEKNGVDAELTPNEFKLLATFVKHPGKVFTREELIESTFGYEYEGYSRTIDSHIRNIRSKIEDSTRQPAYIKTVHGIGYLFEGGGAHETKT